MYHLRQYQQKNRKKTRKNNFVSRNGKKRRSTSNTEKRDKQKRLKSQDGPLSPMNPEIQSQEDLGSISTKSFQSPFQTKHNARQDSTDFNMTYKEKEAWKQKYMNEKQISKMALKQVQVLTDKLKNQQDVFAEVKILFDKQVKEFSRQIFTLKDKLEKQLYTEADLSDYEEIINSLKDKLIGKEVELQKQQEKNGNQMGKLELQISNLLNKLKKVKSQTPKRSEIEEVIQKMQEEINNYQLQQTQYQNKIKNLKETENKLESESFSISESNFHLKKELERAENLIKSTFDDKGQFSDLFQEIVFLKDENERLKQLKTYNSEIESEIQKLEDQNLQLQSISEQNEQLMKENKDLSELNSNYLLEIDERLIKLQEYEEKNRRLIEDKLKFKLLEQKYLTIIKTLRNQTNTEELDVMRNENRQILLIVQKLQKQKQTQVQEHQNEMNTATKENELKLQDQEKQMKQILLELKALRPVLKENEILKICLEKYQSDAISEKMSNMRKSTNLSMKKSQSMKKTKKVEEVEKVVKKIEDFENKEESNPRMKLTQLIDYYKEKHLQEGIESQGGKKVKKDSSKTVKYIQPPKRSKLQLNTWVFRAQKKKMEKPTYLALKPFEIAKKFGSIPSNTTIPNKLFRNIQKKMTMDKIPQRQQFIPPKSMNFMPRRNSNSNFYIFNQRIPQQKFPRNNSYAQIRNYPNQNTMPNYMSPNQSTSRLFNPFANCKYGRRF